MLTRRTLFSRAAGLGALALGTPVPRLWREASAAPTAGATVLVVVELTGGNDGLNTVVPYADDLYHKNRPVLRVEPSKVLKLDDTVGFHPALKAFKSLWDEGQVKVVQGAGYPNPNRSHFRSMEIWQSGGLGPSPTSGWLGATADRTTGLDLCQVGPDAVPLALRGRRTVAQSVGDLDDLRLAPGVSLVASAPDRNELLNATRRRYAAARDIVARLASIKAKRAAEADEAGSLKSRLATVQRLLEADAPFRIYYTSLTGFDTHSGQIYAHQRLLQTMSDAVSEFLHALRPSRLEERVVVLLFSEFGRRLRENASAGTDHGASAPLILAGKPVQGGLLGPPPNLSELEDGDPRFTSDFRDIYSTILRRWLDVDPAPLLGRRDDSLALFQRGA